MKDKFSYLFIKWSLCKSGCDYMWWDECKSL